MPKLQDIFELLTSTLTLTFSVATNLMMQNKATDFFFKDYYNKL